MSTQRTTALARIVLFLSKWAKDQGADGEALVRRAGIDPAGIADPDSRIPVSKVWNLWSALIEGFPDPDLGLRIGGTTTLRAFGVVGYTVYYSSTLLDALHRMARYSRIINEVLVFVMREDADRATLALGKSPRFDLLRHPVDLRLAWALRAAREVIGTEIVPIEARFPYPRPASVTEHARLFRCTLKFDQPQTELVFRGEDLARPVVAGNPDLVGYLDQLADKVLESLSEQMTFADRVRREIWSELSSGKITIQRVATRLGVSSRSLQRRLKEEGTSFGAEFESLRGDMARLLLTDRSLAVCEVAFLLGYSEASSFHRAFRRWESLSPDEYRRAN